jgi:hypothetical protein
VVFRSGGDRWGLGGGEGTRHSRDGENVVGSRGYPAEFPVNCLEGCIDVERGAGEPVPPHALNDKFWRGGCARPVLVKEIPHGVGIGCVDKDLVGRVHVGDSALAVADTPDRPAGRPECFFDVVDLVSDTGVPGVRLSHDSSKDLVIDPARAGCLRPAHGAPRGKGGKGG